MFNNVCLVLCFILQLSTPVQLRNCTRTRDVVFVLDSGRDISDDNWNLGLRLSKDVSRHLYPSTYGTHVAQVQFNGNTSVVHGLESELVISDRSKLFQSGRNVADALETTRLQVLNNMNGDRPEVPDVIVLITYGLADNKNSAITEAARLKSDGIRIIAVGITNIQVDQLREELREIATDPRDVENLMLLNSNYYATVFSHLLQTICSNRIEAANESLRLVDGTSNTGRLEVYINEEWVTVCSVGWVHFNTRIACKKLGFLDGRSMYTTNRTYYHRRIGVANIQCTINDTSLLQCSHDPLFHIDSNCDHRRDVFLRCLCDECNDYTPTDNIRMADGTSISGRLEVFHLGSGWGTVCSTGWTTSNTRVVCRQLGFINEAGTYHSKLNQSIPFVLFRVNCLGNESSLLHCQYSTTSRESCSNPIYIRCECGDCSKIILQAPQQTDAMTHSSKEFKWHLKRNISTFEVSFLSQKNPQTLLYVKGETVVKENTRFKDRIQLINDDYETVGFNLTNITVADMGIYCLHVPNLLLDSKAILVVTNFAEVPEPVINRLLHDSVVLSWDLTPLRYLHYTDQQVILTTPVSGRLPLDYYYTQWLEDNPHYYNISQPIDHLHPSIIINNITMKDAGNYVIEVTLTSSVYRWLNYIWHFATDLVVIHTDLSTISQQTTTPFIDNTTVPDAFSGCDQAGEVPHAEIILGVFFALSILANIGLIFVLYKRNKEIDELKSTIEDHRQKNDELRDSLSHNREETSKLRRRAIEMANTNQPQTPTDDDRYLETERYDDDSDDYEETTIDE